MKRRSGEGVSGRGADQASNRDEEEVRALRERVSQMRERVIRAQDDYVQRQEAVIDNTIGGPGGLMELVDLLGERLGLLEDEVGAANGRIRVLSRENQSLRQRVENLEAKQKGNHKPKDK